MPKQLIVAILLFAGCASAPPPPPPSFTTVPRSVLDALCHAVRAEGLTGAIAVVFTSRPLVTPSTIAALAEVSFKPIADTTSIAEQINQSMTTVPVEIPTDNCAWQPVAPGKAKSDMMAVELSTPFVNPFEKKEAGSLARLSVGGQGATWYWIRLVRRGDHWISAGVATVAAHD